MVNIYSIWSQQHLQISRGDVIFSKLLVSFLLSIHIDDNTQILFALSSDTNTPIQINKTNTILLFNDIVVSGSVESHF